MGPSGPNRYYCNRVTFVAAALAPLIQFILFLLHKKNLQTPDLVVRSKIPWDAIFP